MVNKDDPMKTNALQLEELSLQHANLVEENDYDGETKEDASILRHDDDGNGNQNALFLERFESMMDSQAQEEEATISHLKPLWQALHTLSSLSSSPTTTTTTTTTTHQNHHYSDALTQDDLTRAYTQLLFFLQNQNKEEDDGHNATTKNDNVDPVNQMCAWMACDAQFMLLLPTLLLGLEESSSSTINATDKRTIVSTDLTFYEFVHAYKTVIGGMQTLQRIPPTTVQSHESHSALPTGSSSSSSPRTRATHRTLDMLKLFTSLPAPTTMDDTKVLEESPEEEDERSEDVKLYVGTTSNSSRSRWMVVGLILLFLVDVLFGSFTYWWYSQQKAQGAMAVAHHPNCHGYGCDHHPSLDQLEGQASMLEQKLVASKASYVALQQKHVVQTDALSKMEGQLMEQSRQVRSNKEKRLAMEHTEEQLTQKMAQAMEQHANMEHDWTTCQSEIVKSHNQQLLRTRYVSSTVSSPLAIAHTDSHSPNNDFARRRRRQQQDQIRQDAKERLLLDPILQRTVQRKTWLATLAGAVGAWVAPAVWNALLQSSSVTTYTVVAPIVPALLGGVATLGLVIWIHHLLQGRLTLS